MAQQLSILNDPPKLLEGPKLLHDLIRWEKHTDSCAIDFTRNEKRGRYTYHEIQLGVRSLVSRIHETLDKVGAQSETTSRQHIVPVLLPQSPGLYISQLAILESGGAFCPINLDAPQERIKFVVGDVSADLIITTSEFKEAVSWDNGPSVILVDEFPFTPRRVDVQHRRSREVQPHDLAYVMYTSGSSGTPKGVAVSHLAVSQSLIAHERHIPQFKRFLQFAAPSFDVSVFEIFFPLTRGCTLVGCNRSQLLNDLPGMISDLEVDAAELTPTVAGSLLQKRSNAPSLKLLLTIGEMLTRPIVEEFGGSETKENMLYGMYGPTEAAIHCTIYPKMEASAKPGNIGIPFDTVSTFVADAVTNLEDAGKIKILPVGELGELLLGGPQLAQGYLNREEQNKAAFVHHEGKDYYRTGDKARLLENGTIEIHGRISAGQVKLRGQRVELGEIEDAVYKHTGVKTVAAMVLGSALIVFALVGDESIQPQDVLKTCARWLPKFMIPSEIALLREFPYLPSGKVDKRKLESDYQKQREGNEDEDESSSSMTDTERAVKDVLQEILGPFSTNTRLAAAGLDSLVAIRVASKLRSSGFNVTTMAVLQSDTLSSLARLCESSTSTPSPAQNRGSTVVKQHVPAVLNGKSKDVEFTMPCTPLQSAMLSETAVDEKAYRNWVKLELPGVNDLDQVVMALHTLAEHNSILRTGFTESLDSDGYVQIIWKSLDDAQIEHVQEFHYDFDRSKDSLHHPFRVQLLRSSTSVKLLMHIHHALYDAWSLELLLDDFDALLTAQPLSSHPPFADVVRGYLDGTLLTDDWSSKDYWKDHLAHLDIRRMPNFNSGKALSPDLDVLRFQTSIPTLDVETAAKRLSTSPQSLFQAAYALLLGSYVGSPDVCFGTVFSGRTLPVAGIEEIVGPCLATLPIRVDTSMSTTLRGLVQELNATNRKHLEHSALALRDIKAASELHPRQQLFDTLLIWQQTLHNYEDTREHVSLVDTVDNLEFNLTLEIIPGKGNVELKANYQRSIFPEPQIDSILRQVEQLVQVILGNDIASIGEAFGHLSHDLLSIENGQPDTNLRDQETLSSPVERIAIEDPDRPAINFARSTESGEIDIDSVSYAGLNSRANQMGHYLLSHNVLPDELVCICMEKCVDLYASILATAKIGCGYLPATPDVPHERLQHIVREAKVKVMMAHSSSKLLFKPLPDVMVIYVDETDFTTLSRENFLPRSSPENLSYCVFTSGSTGTPKGVLVTQGNLISNLDVLEEIYPASKNSRFLQSCSQAFDVSVFEIFFTWRIGGCLCSAMKDVLFRDIESAIRALNISHLSLTPTVAALVDPKNVPNVEFLVTAGEAVTQKVFNAWADKGLYQGYGPSETTNICTVNPKVTKYDSINNIGTPFKNTSAFVLSPGPEFVLVPRGAEGEFCFGGSQVFRGYMDRSQEVGKIIEHPTFGRLYRSGDYGRLMPDGSLAFTGRKDDQVKIRGQRVELGEISNVMLRSSDVKDCVAMVVEAETGNSQRLVCFWTSPFTASTELKCVQPDSAAISKLFKNLESALPVYMVPAALIPISHLPSTPQGKIDKRTLVKLYQTLDVNYLDSTSPAKRSLSDHSWTELEFDIAKALAKATQVPVNEVGPDTSFFSLGIDSISAISFSRALREIVQRQVEISDVLKHSSVVRLAERVFSKTQSESTISKASSSEDFDFGFEKDFLKSTAERFENAGKSVEKILPCTPLQEAMLSAADSTAESLYSNQVVLDIRGSVDKVRACWREMVRRHEILRTCFVGTDMPRFPYAQVVLQEYDLIVDKQDLEALNNIPQTNEFEPPYSLKLLQSPEATKLLIYMHHALYDGVSLAVLYEEVETLYHGRPLTSPSSFSPFLQHMASMEMEDADQFWSNALRDVHSTKFKAISPNPVKFDQVQKVTRIHRINAKPPLNWIDSSTKKHSTSLLAVCHAAWSALLSERLQETDICFGNVVSGRTVPVEGIDGLVGPCFNTIPARLSNIRNLTYLEAFRKLQILNADSLPFQLTPLRRLQSKFSPDGSRLFDTLFILQQPPRELDSSIWEIEEDDGAMDFPLVCEVVPKPCDDTLEIILHSYSCFFSEEDVLSILSSFEAKIRQSLENPRRQLLSASMKGKIAAKVENQEKTESVASNTVGASKTMSSAETKLRDVIANFTDVPVERIGRDVSIFRLGLDSISTVQVAARLRKQGHKVLAGDVLEHPTIAQLSAHLEQHAQIASQPIEFDFAAFDKEHRDAICTRYAIPVERVEAIRPCTSIQTGMLAQSLHSDGQEYVNSMWLELPPEMSLLTFKAAWDVACEKHEMLRTGFVESEDPKHPFAMITFARGYFSLPWFELQSESRTTSKEVLLRPWSLSLKQEDGQSIIAFTAHHALYDAQSIQMILSDVAKIYQSQEAQSRPSINSLLGAILRDSEDNIRTKETFWQKEMNKIVVNHFPDLTPLRVSGSTSAVREVLSKSPTSNLAKYCMQNGVTMQAAAQAAWGRLLAAYIGEASTTFGMTLSGRSIHGDADKISFPSIVTLPVRCDVTGTNAELLSRTMSSNASLHKHQFTPLSSIQKWAGYPEGKIFDTLFAYQKLPDSEDEVSQPWKVIREEASVGFAVSLEVQPAKSGDLGLRLTFRQDLIPVEHAELLLRQYDALLLDTLQHPENPCDGAPCVENELMSITPAMKGTLPDSATLLHHFVERGARDWPNKKALEFAMSLELGNFRSQSWTYEELDKEGNKIAQLLVKRGVQPGQIIAICFDKCAEASFAIIGIMKAGCAYVALDPNAPADRLKFIVQDSGAELVLTAGQPGQKIMGAIDKAIINLDSSKVLTNCPSQPPRLSRYIGPQDIAYCLYTSGTTGIPKGCLLTHENAVQAMLSFQILFTPHWTEESKWLQFASFHFDVSVLEQFWSWSVGICVATASRDLIFDDIPGAIQQLGITHIDLTPSLARLIHPEDVPTLCKGVFITGGEQLKQEILDVWGEHACIYNGYGPTEATIGVTMYPRVPKNGKPSNIGPQFENVGSFVLKPGTALPVLRGGIGELCVSGKLVGKGYLNRPDLTTERFPTLEGFNERVYRTGDLVRILHDGSFIFLGRADDQVKLRGQRLELSEINEVIKKSMSDLQEVVTLVLKHSTQQKEQLVTFFVVSSSADTEDNGTRISKMKDACKSRLPGYMVPTHFIPIKALPLNANNKADSKQLAAMYNDMSVDELQELSQSSQEDKDWTENEKRIIGILAKALQVEETALNRGSNLFELGLDSISIIGFSRTLQNAGLENAKLSVVKSNPNIGGLVNALLNNSTADEGRANAYVAASQDIAAFAQRHIVSICRDLGIESATIDSIAPCTPVQEGMIYRFLESDFPLYFNKFEFRLHDGVDPEKLLAAWNHVVAKLQVLRTSFVETDDGYAQVAMKSISLSWEKPSIDYDTVGKPAALKTPYNLDLKRTPSGNVMNLKIFHGLYDGNSLTMLLRCVVDQYQGFQHIEYGPAFPSSLPHGPLAQAPGAQNFWTEHLKGWSPHPIPLVSESTTDIVATSVLDNMSGFEDLRKQLGVTHQAIVQAGWISVLHNLTSPDLTVGMVTSGRAIDFEGADKVIGPLFNTVPFRIKIERGKTFADLILSCHNLNMKMQDFQHTPLKDIQKWSPAKPGQALFNTLFVFQRPQAEDERFAEALWTQVDGGRAADYPLAFEATLSPDSTGLALTIVAQGSVATHSGAHDLLNQVRKSLQNILASAGQDIVCDNTNCIKERRDAVVTNESATYENQRDSADTEDRLFNWTKQTEQIRKEISLLAKVPEDTVRETSSIFELGLDSIDVIKLSSRLKKQGIEIPVSAIIKSQTIANMAAKISTKNSWNSKASSGKSIREISDDLTAYLKSNGKLPSNAAAVLPATPLQQSMVNEMIKSNYEMYFNVEALKLSDNINPEKLMVAIERVIDQSPVLRTTFIEIEDPRSAVSYAQVIHNSDETANLSIATRVLRDDQNFEAFIDEFKAKAAASAAANNKLLQLRLVSVGGARYLVMAISHALYDGRSLHILHEDIFKAYHEELSPRPEFMPFLDQVFQSTTDKAKGFWRTTLSNLPSAIFPRKDSSEVTNPSTVHRLEARSRIPLKDVEALCKASRITLQTLGQTCWALVLSYLMGQLDVVFGSVLSCRDSEEANEVMFPLMNTVAIRSVLHGSLNELLKYMQEMSDTTRQYQHFPLGTAQAYALASRENQSGATDTTLFDTLFIYQGRRAAPESDPIYESVYAASDVEFPVCVEMEIVDDKYLSWTTACKSIARDAGETEQIIEALETVLERIISNPEAQTIASDADDVSVCGLPKFKRSETESKPAPPQLVNGTVDGDDWSSTEISIRKALCEVSIVPEDQIRKDSTIFHLGLDSILVLKLPALLRSYGVNLRVSDILKEQTVYSMARAALRASPEKQEAVDVDAVLAKATSSIDISARLWGLERKAGMIQEILPVTAGQKFMIRQWQISQGTLFFPTFTYSLPGRVNKARLDSAWRRLLQRHDILRTAFVETGNEIVQVVFSHPHNDVVYRANTSQPMRRRSDLEFPPLNLMLEETEGKPAKLELVIHHALYDGISLPILIEELQSLYRGHVLEKPDLFFRTFLAQSISAASSRTQDKWTSYLENETLYPAPATDDGTFKDNQRTEVFHPSMELSNMKQLAQDSGVSVDALFLAAVAKIYAWRLSQDSLAELVTEAIFGIYLANRAPFGEDLSLLTAPTLNLLPLRVLEPMKRSISSLAKDIQRDLQNISSADMACASLREIYEWTGVRVNFFANILKDTTPQINVYEGDNVKDMTFQPVQDLSNRAQIVDETPNGRISIPSDGRCDAYLPSIDLEIRYEGDKIEMGVFAPTDMLSIGDAESMIESFVKFWA